MKKNNMDLEFFCNYSKGIDQLQLSALLENSLCDGEINLVQVDFVNRQKAILKQFVKKYDLLI